MASTCTFQKAGRRGATGLRAEVAAEANQGMPVGDHLRRVLCMRDRPGLKEAGSGIGMHSVSTARVKRVRDQRGGRRGHAVLSLAASIWSENGCLRV
jgi:hypothetical protein